MSALPSRHRNDLGKGQANEGLITKDLPMPRGARPQAPRTGGTWHHGRMSEGFGIESPGAHKNTQLRPPARYLVVIDAAGAMVARLFNAARELVAEFDAGTEEVALMARGLAPALGALGAEWDRGLDGHSHSERAGAEVYTLDV